MNFELAQSAVHAPREVSEFNRGRQSILFFVGIDELREQLQERCAFVRRQWLDQAYLRAMYAFLQFTDELKARLGNYGKPRSSVVRIYAGIDQTFLAQPFQHLGSCSPVEGKFTTNCFLIKPGIH